MFFCFKQQQKNACTRKYAQTHAEIHVHPHTEKETETDWEADRQADKQRQNKTIIYMCSQTKSK